MLEVNDFCVKRFENMLEMEDSTQHRIHDVENNQKKSLFICNFIIENFKKVNRSFRGEKTDIRFRIVHFKNPSIDATYGINRNELLPKVSCPTQTGYNMFPLKVFTNNLQTKNEQFIFPKWQNKWETKCKEWTYQDKFNIEIISFAKKLYLHS